MSINGDLCSDIVGANPVYPPIVDHSWLDVDLAKYDNYPSDNNPVRIIPKLHDLWNHAANQNGLNLIPNAQVMPLGVQSSEEDIKAVDQIVKEAKKAVMAGLKGKELSGHLRARFASKHIAMAQEALKKVAEEIGLLGNVYIDASAFSTYDEAEKFLSQHRTRLARDILMNTVGLHPSVVSSLAVGFHKNVVSSVDYNEDLLNKYRDHLIQSKRIPADTIIASKEDLRNAFLYEIPAVVTEVAPVQEKRLSEEQAKLATEQMWAEKGISDCEARDSILVPKISPIVAFVQENLAKGKRASDIKGMIRSKFAMTDIQDAVEPITVTLSKEGLTEANIDGLVKKGKISLVMGSELKKIGKKFPVKKAQEFEGAVEVAPRPVGIPGYLYPLDGKNNTDKNEGYRSASVEALKKGFELDQVKAKLLKKLSAEEADQVLAEAVTELNSIAAGVVANKAVKPAKIAVEEVAPKQTLPDPSTIPGQLSEIQATFEGSMMDEIDIDGSQNFNAVEIGDLFNRSGLDESMS